MAYSVEKLRISGSGNFSRNFLRPGPQASDQLSGSELRQERISLVLHHPLVSSLRKRAEIANEKLAILKTEFFNRIGHKPPFAAKIVVASSPRSSPIDTDQYRHSGDTQ
jgi:hypothetical protein